MIDPIQKDIFYKNVKNKEILNMMKKNNICDNFVEFFNQNKKGENDY